MSTRPTGRVAQSLLKAASELDEARVGSDVRIAIRDGLLGLEYHLDTLARELARDPAQEGSMEPAARPKALKVESELRALLVAAWGLLALTDDQLMTSAEVHELGRLLRAVQHEEVDLVFAQLLAPQGID